MMPNGAERSLADANLALELFAPRSAWRPSALLIRGSPTRCSAPSTAPGPTSRPPSRSGRPWTSPTTSSPHRPNSRCWRCGGARGTTPDGTRGRRRTWSRREVSATTREAPSLTSRPRASPSTKAGSRCPCGAGATHRLRPVLERALPWLTVQVGLELTRVHLALGEIGAARTVLTETERVLEGTTGGLLADDARMLRGRVAASSSSADTSAMRLTAAELRLLPYLATHLTVPEIASRLLSPQHDPDGGCLGLPQAGRFDARCGHRARRHARAPGELHLPATGESPPQGLRHSSKTQPS